LSLDQQLLENSIQISEHVIVPEANDAITERIQRSRPRPVTFRGVLPAVDFHDEPPLNATEIDDIRPDRPLSFEFQTGESAVAKLRPHDALRIRHVLAQIGSVSTYRAHASA
jgi:hypothetical protein